MLSSDQERPKHSSTALSSWCFLSLLVFVIHVSLVPYDFSFESHRFVATNSLPDIISNLFLYVPLGITLSHCLLRRGATRITAIVVATIALALVSYFLESAQALTQSRVASRSDVVSNVIGAAIGAAAACVSSGYVWKLRDQWVEELRIRPRTAAAKAYVLILVIFATLPFSFSFDVVSLAKNAKQANWVPFGSLTDEANSSAPQLEPNSLQLRDRFRWENQSRWLRWTIESASFVLFVWLLYSALRREFYLGSTITLFLTFWFGGVAAVLLSILQAIVLTRGFDCTDIIFRGFGILIGGATVYFMSRALQSAMKRRDRAGNWSARLVTYASATYIVIAALLPFRFDVSPARVWQSLSSIAIWPFFTSFESRFDILMLDIMTKTAAYVVFGAAASAMRSHDDDRPFHRSPIIRMAMFMAVATEVMQMFLPARVPSLSDVVLAAGGSYMGIRLHITLLQYLRPLQLDTALRADEHFADEKVQAYFSPVDELIASLYEPSDTAPREQVTPATRRSASSVRQS